MLVGGRVDGGDGRPTALFLRKQLFATAAHCRNTVRRRTTPKSGALAANNGSSPRLSCSSVPRHETCCSVRWLARTRTFDITWSVHCTIVILYIIVRAYAVENIGIGARAAIDRANAAAYRLRGNPKNAAHIVCVTDRVAVPTK